MQVLLTIQKDKRNIYCGHVHFMNNLLVEHGRSQVEVGEKLVAQLQALFEISADALQLTYRTHHAVKALNSVRRLKGKTKNQALQVSFNSQYFI